MQLYELTSMAARLWPAHDTSRVANVFRTLNSASNVGMLLLDPRKDWYRVHEGPVRDLVVQFCNVRLGGGYETLSHHTVYRLGHATMLVETYLGDVRNVECDVPVPELLKLVAERVAAQMSCALMTEESVRAEAPGLVRPLVSRERALRDRLSKYLNVGINRSVLLYGPPGSAKTTAACSIAESLVGSYIRVAAPCISSERLELLTQLAPKCVIVDDIDRHHDPDALLGALDDLNRVVPLVFATANERSNIGAAQSRTGRLDIHEEVASLDSETFVEIANTLDIHTYQIGPNASKLLASDLVEISERLRADDAPNGVPAIVDELLVRRKIEHVVRPFAPAPFAKLTVKPS
jgi:hypothetical protein